MTRGRGPAASFLAAALLATALPARAGLLGDLLGSLLGGGHSGSHEGGSPSNNSNASGSGSGHPARWDASKLLNAAAGMMGEQSWDRDPGPGQRPAGSPPPTGGPPPQDPVKREGSGEGRLALPPTATGRYAADPLQAGSGLNFDGAGSYSALRSQDSADKQRSPLDLQRDARRPGEPSLLDKVVSISDPGAGRDLQRAASGLIRDARRKLAAGDYEGALDELTRAAAIDPTGAALARRAEVYNRMGRYDLAHADALEATKRDQSFDAAFVQLAFAAAKLGRLDEALKAADEAIRLNPSNATAYYVRYLIKGRLGDWAGALRDLEQAARLSPEKFQSFLDQVRGARRFVDPDDQTTLGDSASRVTLGLPLWLWSLATSLAALAAGFGGAFWLLRRKRTRPSKVDLLGPDGRLAGKYQLGSLIGRGGMGNVFEAFDHSLGRPVAIKKMSDRLAHMAPQARALLIQEAKTVAVLHHPSIVAIHEILSDGADLYLVFELVRGKTAMHLLAEQGRLPVAAVAEILFPVCQALEFAHSRGLVHRDLKPSNIMITEDGQVKLMDFGVARSLGERVVIPQAGLDADAASRVTPAFARTTSVVGTPHYMAPETEQGIVSRPGDVYALGVCLYELTTGRLPFAHQTQKLALDCVAPSAWRPDLPAALDALVGAALQPDPAARLQTPREFAQRLQALAAAAPATTV